MCYLEVVSSFLAAGSEGHGSLLEGGQLLGEVLIVQVHEVGEEGVGEEVFSSSELKLTSGHLDEVAGNNRKTLGRKSWHLW